MGNTDGRIEPWHQEAAIWRTYTRNAGDFKDVLTPDKYERAIVVLRKERDDKLHAIAKEAALEPSPEPERDPWHDEVALRAFQLSARPFTTDVITRQFLGREPNPRELCRVVHILERLGYKRTILASRRPGEPYKSWVRVQ